MDLSRTEALRILGLKANASLEDVRKAYKRLALQWHPDKNVGVQEAAEVFKLVSAAYSFLLGPGGALPDKPDMAAVFSHAFIEYLFAEGKAKDALRLMDARIHPPSPASLDKLIKRYTLLHQKWRKEQELRRASSRNTASDHSQAPQTHPHSRKPRATPRQDASTHAGTNSTHPQDPLDPLFDSSSDEGAADSRPAAKTKRQKQATNTSPHTGHQPDPCCIGVDAHPMEGHGVNGTHHGNRMNGRCRLQHQAEPCCDEHGAAASATGERLHTWNDACKGVREPTDDRCEDGQHEPVDRPSSRVTDHACDDEQDSGMDWRSYTWCNGGEAGCCGASHGSGERFGSMSTTMGCCVCMNRSERDMDSCTSAANRVRSKAMGRVGHNSGCSSEVEEGSCKRSKDCAGNNDTHAECWVGGHGRECKACMCGTASGPASTGKVQSGLDTVTGVRNCSNSAEHSQASTDADGCRSSDAHTPGVCFGPQHGTRCSSEGHNHDLGCNSGLRNRKSSNNGCNLNGCVSAKGMSHAWGGTAEYRNCADGDWTGGCSSNQCDGTEEESANSDSEAESEIESESTGHYKRARVEGNSKADAKQRRLHKVNKLRDGIATAAGFVLKVVAANFVFMMLSSAMTSF